MPEQTCPKCGREGLSPQYHKGATCCDRCHQSAGLSWRDDCAGGRREHLSYTCRCGYFWHEDVIATGVSAVGGAE